MRRKEISKRDEKKKEKIKNAISPSNRDRLMEPDMIGRGTTPERVEYEASIDLSAEESGLEQIDEDEWTDRNFGNSTANDVNTSDDSISDLESDGEPSAQNEVERPLTADETRRLAREWRARYKGKQWLVSFFLLPSLIYKSCIETIHIYSSMISKPLNIYPTNFISIHISI